MVDGSAILALFFSSIRSYNTYGDYYNYYLSFTMKFNSSTFFVILCTSSTAWSQETFPVFRVTPGNTSESRAHQLMTNVFPNLSYSASYNDSAFIARALDNSASVELDSLSGGIWIIDETRLWNVDTRTQSLNTKNAQATAERLIKQHGLLPNIGKPFSIKFSGLSSTGLSQEVTTNAEKLQFNQTEFQLDVSAHYSVNVNLPTVQQPIPIVGGGGNFQVILGADNQLIGYHGVWRDVQNSGVEYKVIPKTESDKAFQNSTKDLKIVNYNSTLAYYSAPFGTYQNYLFPVYVYESTAQFGNDTVQLRHTLQPATEFGLEEFGGCIEGLKTATTRDPTTGNRMPRELNSRGDDDKIWEVGTEWLGVPWGLHRTQANAKGFTDGLLSDTGSSWKSNFDYGNFLVWKSDFGSNDDIFVDNVDFMFYTGHENQNGWVVSDPGATAASSSSKVEYSIVGTRPETPGDLWGNKDLEWLVIAACGPHQDDRIAHGLGYGNAFDRWRGAFDGMHTMLAYASNSADTAEEGKRLAKYGKQGKTLIQAWFKTAQEVQWNDVIVSAMWAEAPGKEVRNDHLPGHGYVSADPMSSDGQTRWLMWHRVTK